MALFTTLIPTLAHKHIIDTLNSYNHPKAKKLAQARGIDRQPHPHYRTIQHPPCTTPNCENPKVVSNWHWTSGQPVYRPICGDCHHRNTAEKYKKNKPSAAWVENVHDIVAHKAGYASYLDYQISRHPYLKYRKDYCENRDGRLGFVCTTTIPTLPNGKPFLGVLDTDHIDENPANNDKANFQTLCKCCHAYKGNQFVKQHGRTPGRKTLGLTY